MKIIAVMGRKGGISKSTLSTNIAAALARDGYRAVLVDSDGQGNASLSMQIDPHDAFHKLILEDAEFRDVLVRVPEEFHGEGNLYLISASNRQYEVEASSEAVARIYSRFPELDGWADAVIVDTSPGANQVHNAFYYTADYVIMPTLCDFMSISSLEQTFKLMDVARKAGERDGFPVANILGIVPNMYDGRQGVHRENLGYIKGAYREHHIFPQMRDLTVWRQASQFGQSIFVYGDNQDWGTRRAARQARKEIQPLIDAVEAILE